MNILVTNVMCVAGAFWVHGSISNFPITLEREWVTLYLPITNDPFGEESSQRGREDRVESHFWLEARDR